jgi:hypothetical protein
VGYEGRRESRRLAPRMVPAALLLFGDVIAQIVEWLWRTI